MNPSLIQNQRDAILWTTHVLKLTIPSVLATGETFSMKLVHLGPDAMPAEGFDRSITFVEDRCPGIDGLPESVHFEPGDGGCMTLDGLTATGSGHAFATVQVDGAPQHVQSNPARVEGDPTHRLFWGDIHIHTTYSNCSPWACKDPEFAYAYAQEAGHLDFAAAADHLRGIASDRSRWPRLVELVKQFDQPGRFVPILGFESSHKTGFGGDNNAYYMGTDGPYFWLDRDDMKGAGPAVTLRQLWDFLDDTGRPYMTIPHHTARAGKYRSFADDANDPRRERLFEIYSGWGSSERRINRFPLRGGNTDEPAYFVDALKAGCRYGVIASSDDHRTLPGVEAGNGPALSADEQLWHRHNGLAGVWARQLTRESLWEAMAARRTIATTFDRTLLEMTVDDVLMGDEVAVKADDAMARKRTIRGRALTLSRGRTDMVLVRNGDDIARKPWSIENPEVVFEDHDPIHDVAITDAMHHRSPFVVYYLRLENAFGSTGWSSPTWLDLA